MWKVVHDMLKLLTPILQRQHNFISSFTGTVKNKKFSHSVEAILDVRIKRGNFLSWIDD